MIRFRCLEACALAVAWCCAPLLMAGPHTCDVMTLAVGSAAGPPGSLVEVLVTGGVSCEVSGFSLAIGHDNTLVEFVEATPGEFLVNHAGSDLAFQGIEKNAEGYSAVYGLFDISFPITVPATAIPAGTVLARMVYRIKPGAPLGSTPLLNRTRTFGTPNPISNVYSGKPGESPIEPDLVDGSIEVTSGPVEGEFLRGNSNDDDAVDISDTIWSLAFLFQGGPAPPCADSADANDDGKVDISDAIYTLSFLFQGGPEPPPPGPFTPGSDPTADALHCFR